VVADQHRQCQSPHLDITVKQFHPSPSLTIYPSIPLSSYFLLGLLSGFFREVFRNKVLYSSPIPHISHYNLLDSDTLIASHEKTVCMTVLLHRPSSEVTGWTAGVRFPEGTRFSFLHKVQTGAVAHSTIHPMNTGSSLPGDKVAGE
jgi:hypothetical protein